MTHKSTASLSAAQKEKITVKAESAQQHKLNEEESLSAVKMIYSQLDTALKELKKERKTQKYFISTAQHHKQTDEDDAETLYNIVNVKQLQCWVETELKQFLETLITF